ncbi:MAG: cryptochrome/photolyase family protein, partial [Brevefilum sp.]
MSHTHIWWIRRDLRLHDNQALEAALQGADQLLPLFIIEPELMDAAAPKRRAFLLSALAELDRQLKALGSRLILRQGPALPALQALVEELDSAVVYTHEDFSPFARQRDAAVAEVLDLKRYPGVVFQHPESILKADGDPYIVYTPYKNSWLGHPLPTPADCLPTPARLPPLPPGLESLSLPTAAPPEGFPATPKAALGRLTAFTDQAIRQYDSQRNRLDLEGTSRLSPYLRFGLVSAREAMANAHIARLKAQTDAARAEIQTWTNELIWREFYTAILYHFPHVLKRPFREDYQRIPWRHAPDDLAAWQNGQTGYPVVDACMRQLLTTG